jgi:hypothetical protein
VGESGGEGGRIMCIIGPHDTRLDLGHVPMQLHSEHARSGALAMLVSGSFQYSKMVSLLACNTEGVWHVTTYSF